MLKQIKWRRRCNGNMPSQGISFLHTKTGSGYQTHTCTGNERAVLRSPWLGLSESRERQWEYRDREREREWK
jgi:hypothetical protein